VLVVVDVVDVVVGTAQPDAEHASQQLGNSDTQAAPPSGARQWAASGRVAHEVTPAVLVRQQATDPGLPQVEREAHLRTVA
jgi:hypothetical protein